MKLKETKLSPNDKKFKQEAFKRGGFGRKGFRYGTNVRRVPSKDGLFREKTRMKGAKKIVRGLASVATAIAPIFLIGDLIWGDTADQK